MPKRFGTSSKSQEARDKKEAARQATKAKIEQEEEDRYWADDDKQAKKKEQRKVKRENRQAKQVERKNELRKLHDQEMENLQGAKSTAVKTNPSKLTQAQIAAARDRLNAQLADLAPKNKVQEQNHVLENPNRINEDQIEARTVEDAICALKLANDSGLAERHPEKRLKAIYAAYEESVLPELRKENPGMRLSQLKQIAFKNFQTAPENPKNQPYTEYNTK